MNENSTATLGPIDEMLKKLSIDAVFGAPVREGNTVVIPVASVAFGVGYGTGSGRGRGERDVEETEPELSGRQMWGSGGGGGGFVRPQGFIRITPDGAQYEPLVQPARIIVPGMLVGAWSVFWIAMTIRAFRRR